jgi:hypothetical protein
MKYGCSLKIETLTIWQTVILSTLILSTAILSTEDLECFFINGTLYALWCIMVVTELSCKLNNYLTSWLVIKSSDEVCLRGYYACG